MIKQIQEVEEQLEQALKRKRALFERLGVWLFVAVFAYAVVGIEKGVRFHRSGDRRG